MKWHHLLLMNLFTNSKSRELVAIWLKDLFQIWGCVYPLAILIKCPAISSHLGNHQRNGQTQLRTKCSKDVLEKIRTNKSNSPFMFSFQCWQWWNREGSTAAHATLCAESVQNSWLEFELLSSGWSRPLFWQREADGWQCWGSWGRDEREPTLGWGKRGKHDEN